jgi:hypothetical protein
MADQIGFFVEERLAGLSKKGDDLERLSAVIDFELFRPELEAAVPRADRSKGGRPPFDHVDGMKKPVQVHSMVVGDGAGLMAECAVPVGSGWFVVL